MNLNYSAGRTDFRAVIPFSKVERMADGRLMIEGVATSEAVDHDNEIVDYESAKAAFATWSGNIREQHDAKKAVGRALSVHADDVAKKITVRAFISNGAKDTQEKCLDGTLSCYSIGGSVEKRTPEKMKKSDGTHVDINRVHVKALSETSVVDKGSNPDSSFSLVKTVGDHLEGVGLAEEVKEVTVQGTDEEVAALGKSLNDNKLTMKDALEAIDLLVAKRAEKPIVKSEEEQIVERALAIGALVKRVSDPELPLVELADIAKTELTDDERKPLKTLDDVRKAIITKASGSMSAANKDRLQAAHDHLAHMGAACGAGKSDTGGGLAKSDVAALEKRIAQLEAQPAQHVVLRAVAKTVGNDPDKKTDEGNEWRKLTPLELSKFQNGDEIDFNAANKFALTKVAA